MRVLVTMAEAPFRRLLGAFRSSDILDKSILPLSASQNGWAMDIIVVPTTPPLFPKGGWDYVHVRTVGLSCGHN